MENESAELIAAINENTTVCKDISGQLLRAIDLLTELLNKRTNSDEAEGTVFSPGELNSVKDKNGRRRGRPAEMCDPKFMSLSEIEGGENFFKPFSDRVKLLCESIEE